MFLMRINTYQPLYFKIKSFQSRSAILFAAKKIIFFIFLSQANLISFQLRPFLQIYFENPKKEIWCKMT